jgi:glycosyltransferase involved in cell wall biosynthesis
MIDSILSIVIPCKNEEKQLGKTLEALNRQTFDMSACPIYVADAGSTDRTLQIIAEFQEHTCLDIRVIEGGYPPAGRNRGASLCQSDFILFLDADIELGEDQSIEKAVGLALEHDLDMVSTYIRSKDGNAYDRFFWERIHAFTYRYPYIVGPYSAGMFILLRKSKFEELGGFNEAMILGDDWELTRMIPRRKFGVADTFIWTTNRRFQSHGYIRTISQYIRVAMSKSYRNRDNRNYMHVNFIKEP